jgi:hypothetical protein
VCDDVCVCLTLRIAFSCTFLRPCACIRRQFAVPDLESPRDTCEQNVQCGSPGQPCCADGCLPFSICTNTGCERCGGYNQLCCAYPGEDALSVREMCPFAGMHLSSRDVQVTASCRTGNCWCCPSSGSYPELLLWFQNHLDMSHSKSEPPCDTSLRRVSLSHDNLSSIKGLKRVLCVGGAACLYLNGQDSLPVCTTCGGPGEYCCAGDDKGYVAGNKVGATQNTCWSGEACPATVPLPTSPLLVACMWR